MGRVDSSEVKMIIDTELTDLDAFINPANIIITKLLTGSGLDEDHLKEIERWLAAHFTAVMDPRTSKEKIGDAEVTYYKGSNTYSNSMKESPGLNETPYGKQVLLLDTTGILKASLGKVTASFTAMGASNADYPETD